ncbi:MAG: TatD family hydrolase [Candidatus Omnitrophota bacterium]
MLIDTHCHLDFPQFDADRDYVLKRAHEAGVDIVVNIGSSLRGSLESVRLARHYPEVFASVGLHPHDAKDFSQDSFAKIKALAQEKKVVAIGEVGLDYFRNLSEPKVQEDVFRRFLALAGEVNLPLIVHCRQAEDEILQIFQESQSLKIPGVVVHCFSGSQDFLQKCLDLGFFVSFTCNITYKKSVALKELVRVAPLDRIFLETDAPYLPPEGKRGMRNEPAAVRDLAQEIAWLKGIDFEMVCAQTTQNAKQFFKIG